MLEPNISDRIGIVRERIEQAATLAGRDPASITLVAVTKTYPPELVAAAIAAGASDLGENRVQEAAFKIAALQQIQPAARWHLIGHLQRNKARLASELFDLIHSVDSLRLADALSRHMPTGRRMPILLQFNVSGEESKEGFNLPGGITNQAAFEAILPEIEQILALPNLEVRGLMTVAPIVAEPDQARPTFRALRELRDELARLFPQAAWRDLSMGMTDDMTAAIAEGSTIVRVGRAIFGPRQP